MTDYDSRRTGNGSLDAGSTPAYSINKKVYENQKPLKPKKPVNHIFAGFFMRRGA